MVSFASFVRTLGGCLAAGCMLLATEAPAQTLQGLFTTNGGEVVTPDF